MSVLTKVLGDPNAREVKRHLERVAEINQLEPLLEKLDPEELKAKSATMYAFNDYLAGSEAGWNAPIYQALGMSVAVIGHEMSLIYDPDYLDETHPDPRLQHLRPVTRAEAYQADITYGTNSEF